MNALGEFLAFIAEAIAVAVVWCVLRFWIGLTSLAQGDPDMEGYL